ncbi:MAG: protein-export chaperone SecB [Gammaproteobacteria bacterium]|nr:protein-export chaperone SecB [Gammaproteobacteria bacterium]
MTDEQKSKSNGKGTEIQSQEFMIQKVYVKDMSFETPNSPDVFSEKWEPSVNLEINTAGKNLNPDVHEVVLTVTVSAKIGEKTAYLIEVQQAGIFSIKGLSDQELSHALGSYCPNILFPYAREVVSDLVVKGGFPQLLLSPINFDALYSQHMQRVQEANKNEEQAGPVH